MKSADREEFIESIFVNDQIVPGQLKEFLKMVSNQLSEDGYAKIVHPQGSKDVGEEIIQGRHSGGLMSQCEQRLAKVADKQKSRIVTPPQDMKLDTIIAAIESLKRTNDRLQSQLNKVTDAQEKFRRRERLKKQHYQDLIDTLYTESLNSEICNLRRLYYGVNNLTDELAVKCNDMAKEVKSIQEQIFVLMKMPALEKKVTLLLDWRASLREEFELFTERYEHVKAVSISRCEVDDLLKRKVDFIHLDKYISKANFNNARKEFVGEFDQLKELVCELQLQLNAKIVSLHKDVQRALTELASKRRLEKRGNKVKQALCQ